MLRRIPGALLALAAHAALGATVWFLFPFLQGLADIPPPPPSPTRGEGELSWPLPPCGGGWGWGVIDGLLVLQFCLPHSLLLLPAARKRMERVLPSALHGCFFCLTTCLSLLLLILAWRRSPVIVWRLEGWPWWAVCAGYLLSWGGLLYALSLTGYGWQTGWTPFWAWFRGAPPPARRFTERGAYRWLRHPVYLAFLGQVWLTPTATLDRALLIGLLTVYIAVGSWLKDPRLLFYMGDAYRRYQARVPGYPLVRFGPLGRVAPRPSRGGARFAPTQVNRA